MPRLPFRLSAALAVTLALASLTVTAPSGAATAKPTLDRGTRAALEAALTKAVDELGVPGAVVGVQVDGKVWIAKHGVADTTTQSPVSTATHTRIGSLTKTMTGTIVLQLVDEKKLSLADTIDKWFPELPDAGQITIRDLGTMQSGIASYTKDAATVASYKADPQQVWTPQQLIAIGTSLPRTFPPGDGFEYSNTNFVMLGQIIEQVTGKPLPTVFREKLFGPLHMKQSDYPLDAVLADPHWQGYTDQSESGAVVDATTWSPTFASSAGEATSTVRDVLVWAKAVGTGSLLTKKTQAARLVGNPASKAGTREYLFALGRDNGWLTHDGDIPGFNSDFGYFRAGDISIAVLVNSDVETPQGLPASALFNALAAVLTPASAP